MSPEGLHRYRERGFDIFAQMELNQIPGAPLGCTDGRILWAALKVYIATVVGWAKLIDPEFMTIKLNSVQHTISADAGGGGGSANGDSPAENKQHTHLARHPNVIKFARETLDLAQSDDAVNFVMNVMTQPVGWTSLYLIFETIRHDVGGEDAIRDLGDGYSRAQVSGFRNGANNNRSLAQGSRHAGPSGDATAAMSLSEAHSFIRNLTSDWIADKLQYEPYDANDPA